MFCKKCGTEFEGGFCPKCGAPAEQNIAGETDTYKPNQKNKVKQKKPIYKKWWFWVIIAIVLIGIIGSFSGKGGSSETSSGGQKTAGTVSSAVTTTLPAETAVLPGNSVSTDKLKITFVSCNANAKDYNKYAEVKSGYKVVRADFEFENITSTDQYAGSIYCYADGTKCESFFSGDSYKNPCLDVISAGRKTTGVVYFEVPANAAEIELEIEDDYWRSTHIVFSVQ